MMMGKWYDVVLDYTWWVSEKQKIFQCLTSFHYTSRYVTRFHSIYYLFYIIYVHWVSASSRLSLDFSRGCNNIHTIHTSGARYALIHDMKAVVGTTRLEVISPPRCLSLSLHEMIGGELRRSLRRGCSSLWIYCLLPPEEGTVVVSSFPMFVVVVVYFRCVALLGFWSDLSLDSHSSVSGNF